MTTKKSNALKRQIYGTPLPLPCLQESSLKQQPHQQNKSSPSSSAPPVVHSVATTYPNWTPLDTLFELLGRLYNLCRATGHAPPLNLIQAEFHPQGQSVWVKGDKEMEILFRQGFFGKGTLSRSEATWKQRHTAGTQDGLSLEEITRQRRLERAKLRNQKASQSHQGQQVDTTNLVSPSAHTLSSTQPFPPVNPSLDKAESSTSSPNVTQTCAVNTPSVHGQTRRKTSISQLEGDYEHLQLSLEETFFLVFAVECLSVTETASVETAVINTHQPTAEAKISVHYPCSTSAMSIQECWLRFCKVSAVEQTLQTQYHHALVTSGPLGHGITPNNPFIVRYVVYHYYRSQGWIVKDGLNYGTDFLLYKKGMVFGHSHYAVKVVPCESDLDVDHTEMTGNVSVQRPGHRFYSFISPTPGLCQPHGTLSWQWLLTLNRVVAQVQKTVILCHVVLPKNITKEQLTHPWTALPLYTVVEIGIKRFIPERNRA